MSPPLTTLPPRNVNEATPRTVLLVDDDPHFRRLLRATLEKHGFRVAEAASGREAIGIAPSSAADAVLLDLGLPDMDGLAVLKRLREWSQAPVIVLSARVQEEDKVSALDHGANDYVTKPFGTGELLARLRASLRLAKPATKPPIFRAGPLQVDLAARAVTVRDKPVRLTATEYALLLLFIQNAGKVLTHSHIVRELWAASEAEKTGQLRVYVAYLREKLEANPAAPELLITECGIGYRLAATH